MTFNTLIVLMPYLILAYLIWTTLKRQSFLLGGVRRDLKAALTLSLALMGLAIQQLRLCTGSTDMEAWLDLLGGMFDGKATMRTELLLAVFYLVLAVAFLGLVAWSWLTVPPSQFKDEAAALRYFVQHRRGSLDYAILLSLPAGAATPAANWNIIAEAANNTRINDTLARLRLRDRSADAEIEQWRACARRQAEGSLVEENARVTPARQDVLAATLKLRAAGGHFVEELRGGQHPFGPLYLFAATWNTDAFASGKAQDEFTRVVRALSKTRQSF